MLRHSTSFAQPGVGAHGLVYSAESLRQARPSLSMATRVTRVLRAMLAEARAQPVTVSALARSAGVHPVHFARVYRAATGETPGEARRRFQVSRAASAVSQTRESLAEIASESP